MTKEVRTRYPTGQKSKNGKLKSFNDESVFSGRKNESLWRTVESLQISIENPKIWPRGANIVMGITKRVISLFVPPRLVTADMKWRILKNCFWLRQ